MCMSRFHRVIGPIEEARALVEDVSGRKQTVSLLAYEGPLPKPGDWLVAQCGYALGPADPDDAEAALAELGPLLDGGCG